MKQFNQMTRWLLIALCMSILSIYDTIAGQQSSPKTVDELIHIQKARKDLRPSTVHMVFTEDTKENRSDLDIAVLLADVPYKEEVGKILADTSLKKELWIDRKNNISKSVETTTRDVGALMKKYNLPDNLPESTRLKIENSRVYWVIQPPYIMNMFFLPPSNLSPSLSIDTMDDINIESYIPSFGSLGSLAKDTEPSFNEIKENGKDLLRITYKGNGWTKIIDSIPSLGYVLYHKKDLDAKGRLSREEIADDYRNANGVQYPFLHIERRFDPSSGKLKYEQKYTFEKVEFGVPLSADDFKIYVPIGALVEDLVTGRKTNPDGSITMENESIKITTAGYRGIQDVLEMVKHRPNKSHSQQSENKK